MAQMFMIKYLAILQLYNCRLFAINPCIVPYYGIISGYPLFINFEIKPVNDAAKKFLIFLLTLKI